MENFLSPRWDSVNARARNGVRDLNHLNVNAGVRRFPRNAEKSGHVIIHCANSFAIERQLCYLMAREDSSAGEN